MSVQKDGRRTLTRATGATSPRQTAQDQSKGFADCSTVARFSSVPASRKALYHLTILPFVLAVVIVGCAVLWVAS